MSFAYLCRLQYAQLRLSGLKKYQFSKNSLLQRGQVKLAIRIPAQAIAAIQASAMKSIGTSWRSKSFST